VGPLFYYELVRLARRGRSTAVRCAYVLIVFAALYIVFRSKFPNYDPFGDPFATQSTEGGRMADLASAFVSAVLVIQTLAIVVLTPAYLAGVVIEERERGTLDLLLTTQLRPRHILFGKLAARVTHLGGVLLAGLPLLAATQLWGGVDFFALLAAFVAAGFNLLGVGCVSLFLAVGSHTFGEALASSYFMTLVLTVTSFCPPLYGVLTPYGVFEATEHGWAFPGVAGTPGAMPLVVCALLNGLIAAFFGTLAVMRLRPREAVAAVPKPKTKKTVPSPEPRPRRPVGNWPLLWKEMYTQFSLIEMLDLPSLPALTVFAVIGGWLASLAIDVDLLRQPALVLCLVFIPQIAGMWCGSVAVYAAGNAGRERERRTLDDLLMLPVSRSTVLGAKWLAAVLQQPLAIMLVLFLAFSLGLDLTHPGRVVLLAALLAAQVAFLASLGIWLSMVSRTALRARVLAVLALCVFFVGAWCARSVDTRAQAYGDLHHDPANAMLVRSLRPDVVRALVYENALNPLASWVLLAIPPHLRGLEAYWSGPLYPYRRAAIAYGSMFYALAAGVLWLDAVRRFRREGSGE
jgi:ABC-type transport system involved in multi-copper enzyme maturation permease subunit